jgi:hypothetical protein
MERMPRGDASCTPKLYSIWCVEGEFCEFRLETEFYEVRLYRILGKLGH